MGTVLLGSVVAPTGCGGGAADQPGSAPPAATTRAAPSASPAPSSSPSASTGQPSPTRKTNPAAKFCQPLKADGATGADFGPIATFSPKDQLLEDVRGKREAMGTTAPPAEIEDEWQLQKAEDTLTDYWFDHCA